MSKDGKNQTDLESRLAQKEQELSHYRSEITKLNVQLRNLIEQINAEIKTAAAIQRALVPTEIPNIPGFDFSTKFVASMVSGGDYFDLFEHDDKFRFGMVLSCASGYGMSALFMSVLMKLSSQIEAKKGTQPHEALSRIVHELKENIQPTDNADIFYAVVDRRTYELTYCLAGEISAFHQSGSSHQMTELKKCASRIDQNFSEALNSQSLRLEPKDRLVLVSRGVVGAKNKNGHSMGAEQLREIIESKSSATVHELRNEILFQVERWSGKSDPERDLTVLVVDVKERILKLARK